MVDEPPLDPVGDATSQSYPESSTGVCGSLAPELVSSLLVGSPLDSLLAPVLVSLASTCVVVSDDEVTAVEVKEPEDVVATDVGLDEVELDPLALEAGLVLAVDVFG